MKSLLIDGDGIIYRCGFAVEKTKYVVTEPVVNPASETGMSYWGKAFWFDTHKEAKIFADKDGERLIFSRKEVEPLDNAIKLVNTCLDKILNRYSSYEDVRVIIGSPEPTFRDKLATTRRYKGNRDGASKPVHFTALREYLCNRGAEIVTGIESDDALCTAAWGHINSNRDWDKSYVVVSLDKDLDQIPGLHYNWIKEEEYYIGKKEGALNLYCQILSGDSTDNISGLEGVGPVKARKMLEGKSGVRDCWETVLSAYRSAYGVAGEARAIETARLVYLLRKEGEVWTPPEDTSENKDKKQT